MIEALGIHEDTRQTLLAYADTLGIVRAQVCSHYRSGLDLNVAACGITLYAASSKKGLFPQHLVIREAHLPALLKLAAGRTILLSLNGLRTNSLYPAIRITPKTFDLHLKTDPHWDLSASHLKSAALFLKDALKKAPPNGLQLNADPFTSHWPGKNAFSLPQIPEDEALVSDAMRWLLGRGAGSTPSGDDMLVAACALNQTLAAFSHPGAQAWLKTLKTFQPHFDQLTTQMSSLYLNAALRGEYSSHTLLLLKKLLTPTTTMSDKSHALTRVRMHGATSGIDALTGLALALSNASHLQQGF